MRETRAQLELNRWNEIKKLMGPTSANAIVNACRYMAAQYREDMVATHMPESERVSEQFHKQAMECEMIAEFLE